MKYSHKSNKTSGCNIFNQKPKTPVILLVIFILFFIETHKTASTTYIKETKIKNNERAFFSGLLVLL